MTRRTERHGACIWIERVLGQIKAACRLPDEWEGEKLAIAIGSLYRASYWAAEIAAKDALVPISQRRNFSGPGKYSLEALSRAFEIARAEPVKPFPHLGPIVLY